MKNQSGKGKEMLFKSFSEFRIGVTELNKFIFITITYVNNILHHDLSLGSRWVSGMIHVDANWWQEFTDLLKLEYYSLKNQLLNVGQTQDMA